MRARPADATRVAPHRKSVRAEHYVLDLWFEREVKPRLRGEAHLIRYADDFVMTFETKDDAERVMEVLGKRMGRFGLTLHPTKTRLLPFRRPPAGQLGGKGPATFDFLGFTLYWRRSRSGRWGMTCKTRKVRRRRSVLAITDGCRRHRHLPVRTQHAALTRRIQGPSVRPKRQLPQLAALRLRGGASLVT